MSSGKITVLIADDEEPARNRLKSLLSNNSSFKIVYEAENGDQVFTGIIEKEPMVAFLDINMPGASVFNTIPSLKNPPLVVFQTAYSEHGVKAFDIDAVDYLLKPVSRERFNKSLNKIISVLGISKDSVKADHSDPLKDVISVKSGETIKVIQIGDINRISSHDGFSFIHTGSEHLYSDKSLNFYSDLLEDRGFYRISRTEIINLKSINKLHPLFKGQYVVELHDGEKLTISRRRVQRLKELIK